MTNILPECLKKTLIIIFRKSSDIIENYADKNTKKTVSFFVVFLILDYFQFIEYFLQFFLTGGDDDIDSIEIYEMFLFSLCTNL